MKDVWEVLGLVAGATMPVWNVPLIVRIIRRKESDDISLGWLFGVWISMLLMVPAAIRTTDITLKAYTVSNVFFFTGVVVVVLLYRKK
jgi:uncharacterized protein with PQ loop repeat